MEVSSQHPDYVRNLSIWIKCRDVCEGEEAVKARGDTYLPALSKQDAAQYEAYKMRASFFNATDRTVQALNGALFMKTPALTAPAAVKNVLDTVGPDEESFLHIMTMTGDEVVKVGRRGLLVDKGEKGTPYIASYIAEAIINWRTEFVVSAGRRMLTLVVLEETEEDYSEDIFVPVKKTVWRVLRLEGGQGDGSKPVYTQEVFDKVTIERGNGQASEHSYVGRGQVIPRRAGGTTFAYIPFIFFNPDSITDAITKSPVVDLVNVNLSHYRTSADLEHGRHFTALPTPWVSGPKIGTELKVGSETAWALPEKAVVGMLEFSGAGLQSLTAALTQKEAQMAVIGSRLLEPQKREAESADAIKLRLSGEGSVLSVISDSLSTGATEILRIMADWMGVSESEQKTISYKINRDFTSALLSPQDQISLMAQVQAGFLYYGEYFEIMQRARIIPEGRTVDEQIQKIKETNSMFRANAGLLDASGKPQDGRLNSDVKPASPAPIPSADGKTASQRS